MRRFHLWHGARPLVFDVAGASAVAIVACLDAAVLLRIDPLRSPLPLLSVLPAPLRSRSPATALYATAALGLVQIAALPYPPGAMCLAGLLMVYSTAAHAAGGHSRAAFWIALASGPVVALRATGPLVGLLHGYLNIDRAPGSGDWWTAYLIAAVLISATGVITWLTAAMVRARRSYLRAMIDRAERLERERAALDRVAVARERTRIARELHDVVSHSLSVVVLQADGAANVLRSDPDRAERALLDIGQTTRQALAEMRRLLGVLRTPEDGERRPAPARSATSDDLSGGLAPQPGLAELATLIDQVTSSGVAVRFDPGGLGAEALGNARLPAGIGLCAYRIVQEALTNVLKHAGPGATATVSLRRDRANLVVTVTDDGRGADASQSGGGGRSGGGHGHLGMRERAVAVGGTVEIGPRPEGGFQVTATLPCQEDEVPFRDEGSFLDGAAR